MTTTRYFTVYEYFDGKGHDYRVEGPTAAEPVMTPACVGYMGHSTMGEAVADGKGWRAWGGRCHCAEFLASRKRQGGAS